MTYKDFYEPYLDLIQDPGGSAEWYVVRCPFSENHKHGDEKASAGVNKQTGVFNCYVCGSFSPAQFLHRLEETPLDDAYSFVDDFRRQSGLVKHEDSFVNYIPSGTHFERLYHISQELIHPDLPIVKEYLHARRLQYETLREHEIGFLPADRTHWKRDSLVFPYRYGGRVVGIRYRDIAGNKGGEKNCHFTLWGIDALESNPGTVILTEGETDRLRTWEALGGDYPVLSTPTAAFRLEWVREFEGVSRVILIPHSDEASRKMVSKAREFLQDRLVVLDLDWKRRQSGNDIADWLRYNTDQDLRVIVDNVAKSYKKQFMTWDEFKTESARPKRWLIRNLLSREQTAMVGGLPKAHKTWVVLNLIRSLFTGEPFVGIPDMVPEDPGTYNILIIEEEGSMEDLRERIDMTMAGIPDETLKEHLILSHRIGIKIDSDAWIDRLVKEIEYHKIDLLVIDPLQKIHDKDEDSAADMAIVWGNINKLLLRFPDLSIIMIHHFNKMGSITEGWASLRGSIRTAGELDLGIFVESRKVGDVKGARIHIEGRSIPEPVAIDGKPIFKLAFDNGIMKADDYQTRATGTDGLLELVTDHGGQISVKDAAAIYKVSENTVKRWAEKAVDPKTGESLFFITRPGPGSPSCIALNISPGK